MSKLKIEHGASHIKRTKLQCSIEQSIANDIELMAEWSRRGANSRRCRFGDPPADCMPPESRRSKPFPSGLSN